MYDNVEFLFLMPFTLNKNHGSKAYYIFFKAITSKYDVSEDDCTLLLNNSKEENWIKRKWASFTEDLLHFFTNGVDSSKQLDYLFSKEDFMEYFIKYGSIFTPKVMCRFVESTHPGLLQNGYYRNYFCSHPDLILKCINSCARLEPPYDILVDGNFIKTFCKEPNLFMFYHNLVKISRFVGDYPFLEEYRRRNESEMRGIENGILPSLKEKYSNGQYNYREEDFYGIHSQLVNHICKLHGLDEIPKDLYFQELSRYRVIGMIVSNLFETDPYEILIDIETLYEFAIKHNRQLKGLDIYAFLLDYDSHSLKDLLDFYEKVKTINLKDIFYDDWIKEKENMIKEINESLLSLNEISIAKIADGREYRDITSFRGKKILVSNTCIDIDDRKKLEDLIQKVKTGKGGVIWLSLLDEEHQTLYREDEPTGQTSIKFLFGPLDSRQVGIVNHEDAYSWGVTLIDPGNTDVYKRRLYTVEELLDMTWRYNEITHIASTNFSPIGVLCEEKITDEEEWVSKNLGIPIYFKKRRVETYNHNSPYCNMLLYKQYNLLPTSKRLFEEQ